MKNDNIMKALALAGTLILTAMPLAHGELLSESLQVHLNAEAGFTTDSETANWVDQSAQGGVQAFVGKYSARPELAPKATPNGKAAIRFNGAVNNPNQLACQADKVLQVADGQSLSWSLVLKPSELTGELDTYIQTSLDGLNYAWSMSRDANGFSAEVRSAADQRFISFVSSEQLVDVANNWMILTAVYNGAEKTLQLFLTDANGVLHKGNLVSSAKLNSGAHKVTTLGSNTDRNYGADMALSAVLICNAALGETPRLAIEKELSTIYFTASGKEPESK